jgi:YVTN family beta-propeller protein
MTIPKFGWTFVRAISSLSALAALAMAASPARGATRAYVANALEGTVSVVDVRTGANLATVPVGCDPRDIVADPSRSRVYVANTCENDSDANPGSISVIDTTTNAVVNSFPVPPGPVAIAIDGAGKRLYAACLTEVPFSDEDSSGTLHVIDLATGTPVDTIPLQIVPRDLAVTRNGKHAFVSGVAGYRDDDGNIQLNFSGVLSTSPSLPVPGTPSTGRAATSSSTHRTGSSTSSTRRRTSW